MLAFDGFESPFLVSFSAVPASSESFLISRPKYEIRVPLGEPSNGPGRVRFDSLDLLLWL